METGKVKFFNTEKGFGFIQPDSGEADIFVHVSGLGSGLQGQDLREGTPVKFDTKDGKRGLNADKVQLA